MKSWWALFALLWLALAGPAAACPSADEFCGRPQACHRTGGECRCEAIACDCAVQPAEAPAPPAAWPRELTAPPSACLPPHPPAASPALWPELRPRGGLPPQAPEPPPPRS